MDTLATCLAGFTALGTSGTLTLAGVLFVTGLLGSASHCAGMCGPFVLGQVSAGFASCPRLSRVAAGALLPYHCGRWITYSALGGTAGFLSGLAVHAAEVSLLLPWMLGLGAVLLLAQAIGQAHRLLPHPVLTASLSEALARRSKPLLTTPVGWRGFLLGILLGFLPCGLVYAALAAAAAAGSALGGALIMTAFAAGTTPALVGIGLVGAFFGRRFTPVLRVAAVPLLILNAGLLAVLALRAAGIA